MTTPLYILDTNILVHFVRASALWARVRDTYQPLTIDPRPIISVVTAGELRSLALQWKWGSPKLDQVEFVLAHLQSVMIGDTNLVRSYASIDAFCEDSGHPLGKNDLWIAATAAVTGARLLTTDHDFDHISRDSSPATGLTRIRTRVFRNPLHSPAKETAPSHAAPAILAVPTSLSRLRIATSFLPVSTSHTSIKRARYLHVSHRPP